MTRRSRLAGVCGLIILGAIVATSNGEAHKPITSKYTYNEDVFPIVRDRCGRCHVDAGIAPMSLMTYAESVPWGESIKSELMAGHMPPWPDEDEVGRLEHGRGLSAHELDVLLTWASGGTPEGAAASRPGAVLLRNDWPLGAPDIVEPLPEIELPAGRMEDTREFVLPAQEIEGRALRAIDLRPGTPAIVRRATIFVRANAEPAIAHGLSPERVIGIWLPGGDAAEPSGGAAFTVPRGSDVIVRITFRKTWKYENAAVRDKSEVGVYLARGNVREIQSIELTPGSEPVVVPQAVDAIAIRADVDRADADLELHATLPNGERVPLIRLTTEPEWPRRFWFAEPIALAPGTRIVAQLAIMASGDARAVAPRRIRTGIAIDVVRRRD
jgi:hypothetical protein